jgi:GntR family transcriptional regulator/MocR family aminotransferase
MLDDLIVATQGSGYMVKTKAALVQTKPTQKTSTYPSYSKIGKAFLKLEPSLVSNSSEELAFSPGLPPLDIFPITQWKNLSNMYWKEIKFSNLAYAPSSGIDRLKQNICNYLSLTRNLHCHPSQVMIVSGSLQSAYLLGSIFINPGEKIVIENPCFPNIKAIFSGLMARLEPIDLDEEGLQISMLKKRGNKAKLIHVTPSCQYPMGVKMTYQRRLDLLAFASENKSMIIENDYENELNNATQLLPTIFSLDQEQRTVYLGTFNRMLHPSIRIGYMVVPPQYISPIEIMLKHSHRFVAPSIQYVLNHFFEKKHLHHHVENLIKTVTERSNYFKQSFEEIFGNEDFSIKPQSTLGLQSLINIKGSINENKLIHLLHQHHISVHSLQSCYVEPHQHKGIIMGHSSIPKPMIKNKLMKMQQLISKA